MITLSVAVITLSVAVITLSVTVITLRVAMITLRRVAVITYSFLPLSDPEAGHVEGYNCETHPADLKTLFKTEGQKVNAICEVGERKTFSKLINDLSTFIIFVHFFKLRKLASSGLPRNTILVTDR